jgi:hypothetical protein
MPTMAHQHVRIHQPFRVTQSHRHEGRVVYTQSPSAAQIASAPFSNDIVQMPESSKLPPSYNEAVNQEYQQQPAYNPNYPIYGLH